MKVMYQGKEIELEEPEEGEKTLDYLEPVDMTEEVDLRDTIELTEDMINEINEQSGDNHA